MRIIMTGASGLVGAALTVYLRSAGHTVNRMVRPGGAAAPGDAGWDPVRGRVETAALNGVEGIIHLAGANVGEGRWTEARKKVLRESRVEATRVLVDALRTMPRPPRVLVAASAVGYYGSRGEEWLTEESAPGDDFLGRLGRDWEAESLRAAEAGIRTVVLRFGVILSPAGGALKRMLLPFRMGLGGRLGSGQQWMSWVTLPDVLAMIRFVLEHENMQGPVNAVSPAPVRNSEFTRVLARVLGRPALFPVPATALRILFGEMADALLLGSQRVRPARLEAAGFSFLHSDLDAGLEAVLGGPRRANTVK